MILRDYETVAEEFFTELAERGGDRLPALFEEMNTVRMVKSMREMGRTVDERAILALGGQNSICDEYLTKLRMAWEAREAKAYVEREAQFRKEVGQDA